MLVSVAKRWLGGAHVGRPSLLTPPSPGARLSPLLEPLVTDNSLIVTDSLGLALRPCLWSWASCSCLFDMRGTGRVSIVELLPVAYAHGVLAALRRFGRCARTVHCPLLFSWRVQGPGDGIPQSTPFGVILLLLLLLAGLPQVEGGAWPSLQTPSSLASTHLLQM